jgi:hypothetical protein
MWQIEIIHKEKQPITEICDDLMEAMAVMGDLVRLDPYENEISSVHITKMEE